MIYYTDYCYALHFSTASLLSHFQGGESDSWYLILSKYKNTPLWSGPWEASAVNLLLIGWNPTLWTWGRISAWICLVWIDPFHFVLVVRLQRLGRRCPNILFFSWVVMSCDKKCIGLNSLTLLKVPFSQSNFLLLVSLTGVDGWPRWCDGRAYRRHRSERAICRALKQLESTV